jgi:hypothetical protein
MPIYRLLEGQVFDAETAEMLGQCYESILTELKLTVRTDPITLLVAGRVIEFATQGERDPARLRQRVIESLK